MKELKWPVFTPPATALCRRYCGLVLRRRLHGKEANTTNVTLRSTKTRLRIALELVQFLESQVLFIEAEAEAE